MPYAEPEGGSTVLVDPADYAKATVAQARPGYFGKLVGVKGILEGREVPIDETGFFIGRDHTLSQLVISDPRVSKKHCWVGVKGGEVWAVDQGSTNGTYVNQIEAGRITERRLERGDVVIVSEDVSRFEFRLE
jgi:pSer/pThr/pTyr-binding forkhead associated (FHA) protein